MNSYAEVRTRRALRRSVAAADFDDVVDFVASGGYALKTYERFARIKQDKQGRWRVANPKVRQSYRHECRHHRRGRHAEGAAWCARAAAAMAGGSTGVIARGGRLLGEIEEAFIEGLTPGDTFVFTRRGGALRDPGRGPGLCLARA